MAFTPEERERAKVFLSKRNIELKDEKMTSARLSDHTFIGNVGLVFGIFIFIILLITIHVILWKCWKHIMGSLINRGPSFIKKAHKKFIELESTCWYRLVKVLYVCFFIFITIFLLFLGISMGSDEELIIVGVGGIIFFLIINPILIRTFNYILVGTFQSRKSIEYQLEKLKK